MGVTIFPPSLSCFLSHPSFPLRGGPPLEVSYEVWGAQSPAAKRFRCISEAKTRPKINQQWTHPQYFFTHLMFWYSPLCLLFHRFIIMYLSLTTFIKESYDNDWRCCRLYIVSAPKDTNSVLCKWGIVLAASVGVCVCVSISLSLRTKTIYYLIVLDTNL